MLTCHNLCILNFCFTRTGGILVSDDEGLFANINPDPAEPQQHPPYKLMDIFDSTRRAYNKAHANFKKSGHHNPRFWDYVNPEVTTNYGFQLGARPTDVMYLYAWIQKRGEFHDSPSCILVLGSVVSTVIMIIRRRLHQRLRLRRSISHPSHSVGARHQRVRRPSLQQVLPVPENHLEFEDGHRVPDLVLVTDRNW